MIFNEDKLQEEIVKTWGEFGVHNEVFKAMRKQISDLKQLTLTDVSKQRELLIFFLNHLNKNLNLGVSEMWVDDFIRIGKKN